jgi:hypothetical protein
MNEIILQTLAPVTHDLGGFKVHRTLPHKERTMVGPFIFFDQMGPAHLSTGQGIDVRPHPHINLSTVTYLYAGAILHRDSLGTRQRIEPGAVNLMTAGRGSRTRSGRRRTSAPMDRTCLEFKRGWPCRRQRKSCRRLSSTPPPPTCRSSISTASKLG